jgi:hypothetical protein
MKRKLEERNDVNVYDIAEDEEYFPVIAKHSRFAAAYMNNYHGKRLDDTSPVHVTFVHGQAGSGKSRWVREQEKNLYDCPADDLYKWKDGYNNHEAVLYDNVTPENFSPTRLLKELDRYKIQVPVKGSFVWWKPKRIYITSVHSIEALASKCSESAELIRRISVYKCPVFNE